MALWYRCRLLDINASYTGFPPTSFLLCQISRCQSHDVKGPTIAEGVYSDLRLQRRESWREQKRKGSGQFYIVQTITT